MIRASLITLPWWRSTACASTRALCCVPLAGWRSARQNKPTGARNLVGAALEVLRDLGEVVNHDISAALNVQSGAQGASVRRKSRCSWLSVALLRPGVFHRHGLAGAGCSGLISVNPSLCQMLGHDEGDLIGIAALSERHSP
ncbi:hypothetical protein DSL92_01770 [Billgrantia gudaonensis]|uniref:Uncharacterized protein n=1 Tax=Billgrantia gudaonensis TaxID=376427 RepID=A0A432JL99_9GAMM|nr:hypothetical protein DSL92_01770 [Halomonas gudaonensis]